MALPSLLHNELRQTLMNDGPFDSNEELRGVFADPRLSQWRHSVPEASNRASRVNLAIAKLLEDWNANGENALYLFLVVLSEQVGKPNFADLAESVRVATIQDKITACQQELTQIAEHLARGWSDPAYASNRRAKVEGELWQWEERLKATPVPISVPPGGSPPGAGKPTAGLPLAEADRGADETYTGIEIHIAPREVNAGVYAVTAEVDGGGEYSGTLQMGAGDREALLAMTDPAQYGCALFDALFQGNILAAYLGARANAPEGRLRLRLRIAHDASDLHALVWERLHYPVEGGAFPVATDAKSLFSRYIGLQRSTASAIAGPVRMLCVIANPQDLAEKGFSCLDVPLEIANLRAALDGLRQAGVDITIMPGQTGLSADLTQALADAGYAIRSGATTFDSVFEALAYAPGYHGLHFVGHGAFSERMKRAALVFENDDGQTQLISDSDLTRRLNGLDHKPSLIFLAACESASRPAREVNPFVGLAPRLVQIGIPAVIAMQDKIGVGAARTLTRHFYRFLLQHGIVDKALNQARGFLADGEWDIPALFMRLREGRLLESARSS